MFRCPVGVWVIEQRAIMLNATVRSPTVISDACDSTHIDLGGAKASSSVVYC